jgi:hypothetical protein
MQDLARWLEQLGMSEYAESALPRSRSTPRKPLMADALITDEEISILMESGRSI